jgi:PAS domain-containing protein
MDVHATPPTGPKRAARDRAYDRLNPNSSFSATGGEGSELLRTLIARDPDGLMVVGRSDNIIHFANPAAAALLGRAHERGLRCRGVVASGGHMASRLVDALGADRLGVAGEVAPLCPRGTVQGGPWSGLPVVTKGGLVGEDATLDALVENLWKEDG